MNYKIITYLIIGAINTIIDISVIFTLVSIFGQTALHIAIFNITSYTIGVISGFYLNGIFTFKDKNLSFKKFLKLYASAAFGVVINTVIVILLIKGLLLHIIIAKIFAACIVVFYNYTMCNKFIFNQ